MTITKRFLKRRSKGVEVTHSASMNLAPVSKWVDESIRVQVRFDLPESEDSDYGVEPGSIHLRMTKEEALILGRQLVTYGVTEIEDNEAGKGSGNA